VLRSDELDCEDVEDDDEEDWELLDDD